MRSLNAHLTEAGSHGHLPFHPGCPVCRAERLAGRVACGRVISQRAQASLLAAVLALSAGGPGAPAVIAAPPGDEGGAAPNEGKGPGEDEPGFDPGDEVGLPNEVPQPPPAPAGGDDDESPNGPVEDEPQEPHGQEAGTPAGPAPGSQASPPASAPAQPPPAASAPQPQAAPTVPAAPQAAPTDDAEAKRPQGKRKPQRRAARRPARSVAPPSPPAAAPAPAPTLAAQSAAGGTPTTTAGAPGGTSAATAPALSANADTYTVRRGDSLWSIARRQLGADASPAGIALEVDRLWTLNADRIGTGDPDLIMPGQTLRLR